ncbi:hypothetical protein LPB03_12555 [Polaribacter vadi]|uniref:Secretion system C-terminal sorting domain-containing protein n=1 Tax=Polaribacter vadi TaxID=1774273 RepID=A0A1B8TTW0_9FLAO|nr:hypothetical protein [Polaribacter vadi]AOW18226.1 hypothetical protein LPB03_12555 [Polaribacter vadi]OBY62959.1 hypothetical protein LPB3_12570 [Polaribacter vadi]
MRTIKRKVFVAIFMLVTIVNFANNNDSNTLLSADKVEVTFNNAKKGNQLTIKEANGAILHSEEILKEGTLVKTFNLSELENGIYTLELEKDFQIVVKSIKINNRNVTFIADAERIIFKPYVRNKENKLMITKIAFDKEPLKISIFYKNEIIYSETLEGDEILNRVYSLDKGLKGEYKVISYNNGRSYVNNFTL